MANRKHNNLEGWVRDVLDIKRHGGEAYDRFLDVLGELIDDCEGSHDDGGDTAEEDDGGDPIAGNTTEVASSDTSRRVSPARQTQRPAQGSGAGSVAASVLDRALDHLAGQERSEAIAELDQLRRDAMGAPMRGIVKPKAYDGTR